MQLSSSVKFQSVVALTWGKQAMTKARTKAVGRKAVLGEVALREVALNMKMIRIMARIEIWLNKVPATPYFSFGTMAPWAGCWFSSVKVRLGGKLALT